MKKATLKHETFDGKPETRRTNSYKAATKRESVQNPKWPEETKDN